MGDYLNMKEARRSHYFKTKGKGSGKTYRSSQSWGTHYSDIEHTLKKIVVHNLFTDEKTEYPVPKDSKWNRRLTERLGVNTGSLAVIALVNYLINEYDELQAPPRNPHECHCDCDPIPCVTVTGVQINDEHISLDGSYNRFYDELHTGVFEFCEDGQSIRSQSSRRGVREKRKRKKFDIAEQDVQKRVEWLNIVLHAESGLRKKDAHYFHDSHNNSSRSRSNAKHKNSFNRAQRSNFRGVQAGCKDNFCELPSMYKTAGSRVQFRGW